MPWLKKHACNPITGEKLEAKDLLKLNISKNTKGEYQCPITYKVFNDHSHIVAIKTTGNVYSYDAIEELNFKPKYFKDLLTDVKFTRKDLITLQDPNNLSSRNMLEFDFVKRGIKVQDSKLAGTVAEPSSLFDSASTPDKEPVEPKKDVNPAKKINQAHYSTGLSAYSTTSTAFTPSTKTVAASISNDDYLIANIRDKSVVILRTNHGELTFELYCKDAPRACYNFVELIKSGLINN